ncbi:hypothetical protein F0U61_08505 [Archangium violaceum]|uniref:hypothetical protein n=1 Tax=Archangium violaceum TaxID=83451 RepID=UPI002B2CBE00|nr:hypothetical protein F0U61_08505 [Archangium violaceum]
MRPPDPLKSAVAPRPAVQPAAKDSRPAPAQANPAPPAPPKVYRDGFEPAEKPGNSSKAKTKDAQPPATSLLTEDAGDGQENCLDRAADWAKKATPELRARSEFVFLKDQRPGAEGQSGHVVVRQGERVLDPGTGKSYDSLDAYLREKPEYQEAGRLSATSATRIFDTPAGSPERAAAVAREKVSPELQRMMVADPNTSGATASTSPRKLNPASVEQANKDFEAVVNSGNLQFLAFEVRNKLQAHANDPDYQAQFIARLSKTDSDHRLSVLNSIIGGKAENGSIPGPFTKTPAGQYTGDWEESDRQLFTNALKAARDAGVFTEADMQSGVAWAPEQWKDIASRMGVGLTSRSSEADAATKKLTDATEAFEDASADAKKKDEELARQLADFGPSLTEKQRETYIKAFQEHPSNKKAYEEKEKAAAELAKVLKDNAPALENAAVTAPTDAGQLQKSLELLADSGQAETAVDMAGRLVQDPNSVTAQVFGARKGFPNKVLENGLPRLGSKLLAEAKDSKDALKQFEERMKPFKTALEGKDGYSDLMNGLEAIKIAESGDFDRTKQLVSDFKSAGPLGHSFAATALVFGAVSAVNAGREGEYQTMIKEMSSTLKNTLNIVAGASGALSDTAMLARFGVDSAQTNRLASFATRLAPGFGLLATSTSLALRAKDLQDKADPGLVIAVVGDVVGVLGALVETIPGGQAPGLLVSGAGALITAAGEGLSALGDSRERNQQQNEFLKKAGLSPEAINVLTTAQGDMVRQLAEGLEIPPEDIQKLATLCPELVSARTDLGTGQGEVPLHNLVELLKAGGIKKSEATKLLLSLGKGAPDEGKAIVNNLHALNRMIDRVCQEIIPREQGTGAYFIPKSAEDWARVMAHVRKEANDEMRPFIDTVKKSLAS